MFTMLHVFKLSGKLLKKVKIIWANILLYFDYNSISKEKKWKKYEKLSALQRLLRAYETNVIEMKHLWYSKLDFLFMFTKKIYLKNTSPLAG